MLSGTGTLRSLPLSQEQRRDFGTWPCLKHATAAYIPAADAEGQLPKICPYLPCNISLNISLTAFPASPLSCSHKPSIEITSPTSLTFNPLQESIFSTDSRIFSSDGLKSSLTAAISHKAPSASVSTTKETALPQDGIPPAYKQPCL